MKTATSKEKGDTTFAEGVLGGYLLASGLYSPELNPFARIPDCRASLCKLRFAGTFFRWAFSSRSYFAHWASLTLTSFPTISARWAATQARADLDCTPAHIHLLQGFRHPSHSLSFKLIFTFVRLSARTSPDSCYHNDGRGESVVTTLLCQSLFEVCPSSYSALRGQ